MKDKVVKKAIPFDINEIIIKEYDQNTDDMRNLDFFQSDGTDPLSSHRFYENNIMRNYDPGKLIFVIKLREHCIGYFSLNMVMLGKKNTNLIDKNYHILPEIPALMIVNMGIDKNYRCYGIGKYILLFTVGMAQTIKKQTPCQMIVYQTTSSLAEKIYAPKYHFRYSYLDNRLVWIYKKIH